MAEQDFMAFLFEFAATEAEAAGIDLSALSRDEADAFYAGLVPKVRQLVDTGEVDPMSLYRLTPEGMRKTEGDIDAFLVERGLVVKDSEGAWTSTVEGMSVTDLQVREIRNRLGWEDPDVRAERVFGRLSRRPKDDGFEVVWTEQTDDDPAWEAMVRMPDGSYEWPSEIEGPQGERAS